MSIQSNPSKPDQLAAGENPARVFPWFRLACGLWIFITVGLVSLYLAGIPSAYEYFLKNRFSEITASPSLYQATGNGLWGSAASYAIVEMITRTAPNLLIVLIGVFLFTRKVFPARYHQDMPWNLWGLSFLLIWMGTGGGNAIGGFEAFPFEDPVLVQLVRFTTAFATLSYPIFFYTFPDGRFTPRWTRWAALLFLIPALGLAYTGWMTRYLVVLEPFLITFIVAPIVRYRRAGFVQRLQMKWGMIGLIAVPAGWLIGGFFSSIFSNDARPAFLSQRLEYYLELALLPLYLMLPVGIGIAILRSRLWGIDTIIRRALIYSILTGLLGLVYFGSVVLLQSLFGRMAGDQGPLVIALSTLLSAALFTPLRKRIQAFIDYRFFRTKYDASQTLLAFSQTARNEVNIESLRETLLRVVTETVHPASLSLWIRPAKKSRHFIDTISPDSLASSIPAGEGQKS